MNYNLTEKLKFNENPTITINDTVLTVDASAETVLKLMDIIVNESELEGAIKAAELVFGRDDYEKLRSLDLNINDFVLVIQTALSLAIGSNPDEENVGE